jgi:class 3 adenylate cyclase
MESERYLEYRAMGQATDIAVRLGRRASPDTLLLSADTLRLVADRVQVREFEFGDINPSSQPVYELVAAGPTQTRFQAVAARGLTSFVGRSAEIVQL